GWAARPGPQAMMHLQAGGVSHNRRPDFAARARAPAPAPPDKFPPGAARTDYHDVLTSCARAMQADAASHQLSMTILMTPDMANFSRSEERRVGKEGRSRWWADH